MTDITFVVHSEWLDCIANLPVEQQDKIIAEIIRYGTGVEMAHSDDAITQAFVNMVKGRIDYSKDKYAQKVEAGTTAGRKMKLNEPSTLKDNKSREVAVLDASKEPSSPFSTLSAMLSLVISTSAVFALPLLNVSSFPILSVAPEPVINAIKLISFKMSYPK